eukprot:NODE_633_length_5774_cov_0.180617.p4 type:complete len:186 gc:universal NODE_633_length_5774_cov_0.180617:1936-2493(+)
MEKKSITVLISGNGSNLQALIDDQDKRYKISKVISNKENAFGLERAREANIAVEVILKDKNFSREEYDALLVKEIGDTDLVVCAGFMRILTDVMISKYRIINLHPALSNGYIGLHAIERAFVDAQDNKINYSGVMVHYVSVDVDRGELIKEEVVPIYPWDSLREFSSRMHNAEHKLIVECVNKVL